MITSSGPKCDICGKYIIFDKSINPFSISCIEGTLCCHDKCKEVLQSCGKDWQKLPDGPLRQVFLDHESKSEVIE